MVKSTIRLGITCDARVEDGLEQRVHLTLVVNLERLDLHLERLFVFEGFLHLFQLKVCQRY